MSAPVLLELRVRDLGIIDELTVLLGPGLTAVTGETGAGKTLVLTALALIAGARADATIVRGGAAEARVEGRFVDPLTGGETVLARVVPADGRSRAYIDGRLATVGELAELAGSLVDLQGQHSHRSLLEPAVQVTILDEFGGSATSEPLAAYRAARAALHEAEAVLAALGGDERARAREADVLRFQIAELAAAGIDDPDEPAALEVEEALLADAEAHRDALRTAYDALAGAGLDSLGRAVGELAPRAPFAATSDRLRGLQAEVADAAGELRGLLESVVVDPQRLATVQQRRKLLRELGRKYGGTVPEMQAFAADAAARLAEIDEHEVRAAAAEASRSAAAGAQRAAADRLHDARVSAAAALAAAAGEHLARLAMPTARLEVAVEPREATENGADRVSFLLAANAGEPLRPLARAASGGELSRAMLALRVAARSEAGSAAAAPVLVFDEVDAGIGGEAGIAVGRELAALARSSQVICVTHLAQVAAFADAQIVVAKRSAGGRTRAGAEPVDGEARVAELSRMLAGDGSSEHARRHAEELLVAAAGVVAPSGRGRRGGAR